MLISRKSQNININFLQKSQEIGKLFRERESESLSLTGAKKKMQTTIKENRKMIEFKD